MTAETISPNIVEAGAMLVAGLAASHAGPGPAIARQWQTAVRRLQEVPGRIDGCTYGVIFDSPAGDCGFRYLAGVAVSSIPDLPEGLECLEVPALTFAVFPHRRHVSALPETMHAIMNRWLPDAGYEHARERVGFMERYDESFDPVRGTGGLELWIPIVPKQRG